MTQQEADEEEAADNKKEEEEAKDIEDKKIKEEEEKEKMHSIKSKLTLKNVNLEVKEGEFVCIIGETGSGKTSLLNAIIGDMAHMSDKQIEEAGGLDAEYNGSKLFELHQKIVRSKIE
jgi:ABC-type lipoprotein export system ATPase subunit